MQVGKGVRVDASDEAFVHYDIFSRQGSHSQGKDRAAPRQKKAGVSPD